MSQRKETVSSAWCRAGPDKRLEEDLPCRCPGQASHALICLNLHDAQQTRTRPGLCSGTPHGLTMGSRFSQPGCGHADLWACLLRSSQGGACRPDRPRRGSLCWVADVELFQIKRYLAPYPLRQSFESGALPLLDTCGVAWAIVFVALTAKCTRIQNATPHRDSTTSPRPCFRRMRDPSVL
jgi:hypothetical protein